MYSGVAHTPASFDLAVRRSRIIAMSCNESRHSLVTVEIPPPENAIGSTQTCYVCEFAHEISDWPAARSGGFTVTGGAQIGRHGGSAQGLKFPLQIFAGQDRDRLPALQIHVRPRAQRTQSI